MWCIEKGREQVERKTECTILFSVRGNKLSANNLNDCVNRQKHGPNSLNIVDQLSCRNAAAATNTFTRMPAYLSAVFLDPSEQMILAVKMVF